MPHLFTPRAWLSLCCLMLLSLFGGRAFAYDAVVAKDGSGNFTTVQAAINAAPTGRTVAYTIFIKNGRYKEKISVPSTKPFLQLIGESVANTILTYDDGASTPAQGGGTLGTQNSASFSIGADDFSALNITFENSFGDGSQAVAVLVNADRAAFKNCRFLGNQDTIYTKGNGTPRHYFKDCYIDGNVDFIFGSSVALFENCVVYAKARTSTSSSFITAANTPQGQTYGYVFKKTKLPANTGGTQYFLGRPWQNSTGSSPLAANKTVFISSTVGAGLLQSAGWTTWDAGTNTSLITYAEFQSKYYGGQLVPTAQRVSWSRQLTAADTAAYSRANLFGTWDPCAVATGFCTTTTPEIAVANFRAVKGASQSTISWNISWAMSQIKYELFRSSDNTTFSKIYETTAATDSLVNFQTTDALPTAGTAYYYYLRASKNGLTTHTTETIQVSSVPTITAAASLGAFAQYQMGTSAVQTYTLSGVNLTDNVTVTPPAGYEVSANNGTNWYSSAAPLVLVPTSNSLATTTISVRLNATAAGAYAGDITHTSAGATTVAVPVTGTKTNTAQVVTAPLQWWPFKLSAQDSAAVRAAGVLPSTALLHRLTVSDASTVTTIRGYSSKFGQAAAPIAAGSWSTAATPAAPVSVGASLDRRFYEQFTITAAAGRTLRLDTLQMTAAFYNSSNGRMALVTSLTGFTTADSTNIPTGGKVGSTSLPAANYGAFSAPVILNNQTGGPTSVYRFPLSSGTSGLSLTAGQTLTVRVYFGAGTSSPGRYALLKDVMFKGEDVTPVACNAAFSYAASAFCQSATNPAPTVTGTTGGTFSSTTGLSINATTGVINLTASTPGTYTVTYAASATCNSTATVTITAPATAAFSYAAASFCTSQSTAAAPTLATGATAGTFSSTTGLSINATTGAITPSTSAPGTYTVTNTVAASGACAAVSSTATVTITAPPTASFTYPAASYCTSQSTSVTPVLASGASTGTFSSTAGLAVDALTGAISPSQSTPGTYVVTNTVAASGGCAAVTATFTVTITAPATAGFSYASASFCTSQSSTVAPALVTGATAGTFSSTTGLTLNATTGTITPGSSTPGTYTVTNTVAASGACAAVTSTATVTITAPATAGFSYPTTASYCAGTTGTVTPALASGATAGTFSSTTGLSINATTGAINLASSTAGTYTVTNTVAASGGCAAVSSTATVTINATPVRPTVSVQYTTPGVVVLTSSSATGNQWYLNGTPITGATAQTYTANGNTQPGAYTVVVTGSGGCASQVSATLTVTATSKPLAGSSLTVFPNPTPDGKLTLELTGYHKAVELTVLNAVGQVVTRRTVPAGTTRQELDLRQLPAGVYVLRAVTEGGTDTRRIVRQ